MKLAIVTFCLILSSCGSNEQSADSPKLTEQPECPNSTIEKHWDGKVCNLNDKKE